MKKFTYKNQYEVYENCYFITGNYINGNLAISIYNDTDGLIVKVTMNPGKEIPVSMIAIKDYSENKGMVDWLLSMDMIEVEPNMIITEGWITVPVHRLTDIGKEMLGIHIS